MSEAIRSPLAECLDTGKRSDIQNLRLGAAVTIMIWHIWSFPLGGLVSAFFVISGYLISQGLIAQINRNNGRVKLRKFITTVAYRLVPPVATVSIAAFPLLLMFAPTEVLRFEGARHLLSVIGLSNLNSPLASQWFTPAYNTPSLTHEWTVGVQLQAYIVMALLFSVAGYRSWKAGSRKPLFYATSGLLLTSLAVSLYPSIRGLLAIDVQPGSWMAATHYSGLHSRLYQFMAGILIALAMPEIRRFGERFKPAALIALTCGLSMIPLSWWVRNQLPIVRSPGISEVILVLGCVLILTYGVMAQHKKAQRPTAQPSTLGQGLDNLGTYAFAIYLVHWPLFAISTYYFVPQDFFQFTDYGVQPGKTTINAALSILAATAICAYFMKNVFEDKLIETAKKGNPGSNLIITMVVAASIPASFALYPLMTG